MAYPWRTQHSHSSVAFSAKNLFLFVSTFVLLLLFIYLSTLSPLPNFNPRKQNQTFSKPIKAVKCKQFRRASPLAAATVQGLKFPFLYPVGDTRNVSDAPPRKPVPIMRPDVSMAVQTLLGKMGAEKRGGIVVDVGANDGIVSFSAAVMGFKVLAFEPVTGNVMKICEGIHLNRFRKLVTVFQAVVSDGSGNETIGELDKTSVGAKMKWNKAMASNATSVTLDEVIGETPDPVLILKVDARGREYRVLKGAKKLLSRKKDAPYLIYAHHEMMQSTNSSSGEIRSFLHALGYRSCTRHGGDQHCTKGDQ